jgi:hypothetical protein
MTVNEEIDRSTVFGQQLEDMIVNKGALTFVDQGRDRLLLAFWSLAFDYDKSILNLLRAGFYGGAFALVRPTVEALIRAHVTLMGSDEDIAKIKADEYYVNFKTIGAQIDTAFALEGFFDRFLNGARGALHSFTHSGLSQLGRRYTGGDLQAQYDDGEIIEVIHVSTSAVYMITNLVTNRFKLVDEKAKVNDLFLEWGKPH